MNENIKRNMIQVKLNDKDYDEFELLRRQMKIKTNAAAIRQLIDDRKNLGSLGQNAISKLQASYDDLEAKLEGIMRDTTGMSNNINQIAHNTNLAAKTDPANNQTWQWVISALKIEYQAIQKLEKSLNGIKGYLTKVGKQDASGRK